jgi:hypothetical protein
MARVRHTLISLLALLGLLVAIQPTSARATCAMDEVVAMPTMHHHNSPSAPMGRDAQNCPACLGVLPSLPVVEPRVLPPVAQFASQPHTLLGIDPALDPPPPRSA